MAFAQKEYYMELIIKKAEQAFRSSGGNPCVGAMLVHDNIILSEAYYSEYGGAHAEVRCIDSVAENQKHLIPDATLYVTLEPCCIFGKTPPCTNKILEHNIKHVIVATLDPNPLIKGNGIKILEGAGVKVELGIAEEKAKFLLRKFVANKIHNRSYIAIKSAVSSDGYAGKKEESVWLTNEFSRVQAHKLRAKFEGIMVGYNTVNLDNPRLDNRHFYFEPHYNFHPTKIIIDKDAKLIANRQIFDKGSNFIFTSSQDYKNPNPENTEILFLSEDEWNWENIFRIIWEKGIHSLLVEGGPRLQRSIIKQAWWDEAHILSSNSPLGGGLRAPTLSGTLVESLSLGDNNYYFFTSDGA